jgi:putative hydrolase
MKASFAASPLCIFESCRNGHMPAADFHMHTTWTDGKASAEQMHRAAIESGLRAILFSEHARSSSGDWFSKFASEVRALSHDKCRAYVGAEVKVLNAGGDLDICPEIRRECDLVMASVHRFPGETVIRKGKEAGYTDDEAVTLEFELARAALRKGNFDILGHPFGMCYNRFKIAPPDRLIREIAIECARAGIAFEINARYHRNPKQLFDLCIDAGAPISLGSNSHSTTELSSLQRMLSDMGRS